MIRIDRGGRIGVLAACTLAASGFAPMIETSLEGGRVYAVPFGLPVRLIFTAVAIAAAVASLRRVYLLAASFGVFALANGAWLLVMTYRGAESAQMSSWVRPGWGFIPLFAAGAVLGSLPAWARAARAD